MSTVFVLGLGVPLGAVAAFRHGTQLDRAVVHVRGFRHQLSGLVTGIFLLYFFGSLLHWFRSRSGNGLLDRAWHLTLPGDCTCDLGMRSSSRSRARR